MRLEEAVVFIGRHITDNAGDDPARIGDLDMSKNVDEGLGRSLCSSRRTTPPERHKELIAACNLICDHVCDRLPEGWELVLTMRAGEPEMSLFNPDGDEVETQSADSGCSSIDAAVWDAIDTERSRK